ncbi:hypothetical protein ACFTY8_41355 [Streptomyces mirabilis]
MPAPEEPPPRSATEPPPRPPKSGAVQAMPAESPDAIFLPLWFLLV